MSSPSRLYILSRFLCCPLEILFTLLVFILGKNLNALPFQLTLIACIKPITSFFAFYATSAIFDNPQRIRIFLILNYLVGCLPCLLYPYVQNVWFYIGSYAVYMITLRAVYPAWMEILKSIHDKPSLSKLVSKGTSIFYALSIFLPPIICYWMDQSPDIWRDVFLGFAILQLLNIGIIFYCLETHVPAKEALPFENPFKKGWNLLVENPNYTHYLLLFFIGGAGIIGSQPILPIFFKENLNLTYTQLGLAFSFCKGISFVATSPIWARYTTRISLYKLNSIVDVFTCLFFALLLAANYGTEWLYLGYLFYGAMQAGSELSWNISGPFFAGNKESSLYSGLNLAFVGVRGCICPFLGYLLFTYSNSSIVFIAAGLLCASGILYGLWLDRRYQFNYQNIKVMV